MADGERPVAVPREVFYTGEEYAYRTTDGEVVLLGTKNEDEARQKAGISDTDVS